MDFPIVKDTISCLQVLCNRLRFTRVGISHEEMRSQSIEMEYVEKPYDIRPCARDHINHIIKAFKEDGISYEDCQRPENSQVMDMLRQLGDLLKDTDEVDHGNGDITIEEEWMGNKPAQYSPIMKAARYGYYSTLKKLHTQRTAAIEPMGGKAILHVILDGIIASKYEEYPGRVFVENLIAGKKLSDSIKDAYFPPDKYSMFSNETSDHCECLKYVLENFPNAELDINFQDTSGNTALHYAVAWRESNVVKALLQAGAYTCRANDNGTIPLRSISSGILQEYLDSCISSNDYPLEHIDYQVTFDYKLFLGPDRENDALATRESEPIFVMNDSSRLRKFLSHPVIMSYLHIKWSIVEKYFYCNLILYSIHWFLLNSYLFCNFNSDPNLIWRIMILICCGILMLREAFQAYVLPRSYFLSVESWLEIGLIVSTFILMLSTSTGNRSALAAGVILGSWTELALLIGRHPRFSTHIEMFKTVSFNFCKFLALYSILIIAFAFTFYILFKDQPNPTDHESRIYFRSLEMSIFKTLIMLAGQFDDTSIPLSSNLGAGHLFFILFCFFIGIVLLNLLNGLTVGDTQNIRNDAELVLGTVSRINFIANIETMVVGDPIRCLHFIDKLSSCFCWPCNRRKRRGNFQLTTVTWPIRPKTSNAQNLHSKIGLTCHLQDGKIKIFPNRGYLAREKFDSNIIEEAAKILKKIK